MSKKTIHISDSDKDLECLDPTLGSELWRLADPDCSPELRGRLTNHLKYCADCGLRMAVESHVAEGLQDGSLDATANSAGWRRSAYSVTWLGAAALAAGLALLMLLPPLEPHRQLVLRGEKHPAITRPVADEVLLGRRPELQWTKLPDATAYEVQVEAVDGEYRWTTSTEIARATIPEDQKLPGKMRFRVKVDPIPAHASPAGVMRSSFRTSGPGGWFAYRLRYGARAGRLVGGVGMLGVLAGLVAWLSGRRSIH